MVEAFQHTKSIRFIPDSPLPGSCTLPLRADILKLYVTPLEAGLERTGTSQVPDILAQIYYTQRHSGVRVLQMLLAPDFEPNRLGLTFLCPLFPIRIH